MSGVDDVCDDKIKTENNVVDVNSDSKKCDATNAAATGGESKAKATVPDKQNSPISRVNNTLQFQNIAPNREHMVAKATDFLLALPVQYSVEKTFKFLRSKGFSDPEIQESIDRAMAIRNRNQHLNYNDASPRFDNDSPSNEFGTAVQTQFQSEGWFERLIRSTALSATIAYIGYKIYKKYIESWLFGKKKSELEKRFDKLEETVLKHAVDMQDKNTSNSSDSIIQRHEIEQIKTELKSIKGLLLSKCQFPPAPAYSSIPNWQLAKNPKPQVEQPKVIGKSDTPSLIQPNIIPNGIETPVPVQPVNKTENKTNPTVSPNLTQVQDDRAAETPSLPQQNTLYDPNNSNNTSSD